MNTHPQKQTRPTKLSMIKSIIQAFKDHPLSSKPHHGEEDDTQEIMNDYMNHSNAWPVCQECEGLVPDYESCTRCNGTGFNKHHDPYSPEDEAPCHVCNDTKIAFCEVDGDLPCPLCDEPHTTSDHHDLMNSQLEDEALELEVLTITGHTWTLELPGEDAQVCTFPVSDDPRFNITTIMCGSLLVTIQEAGE